MIRKVLVVDNNWALGKLIQNKCGKYKDKFTTLLAGDGLEALEHLKNSTVSLVVTDLIMPNMDGFALIAHLTRTYPDIPVIILTADSPDSSKIDALKAYAMEYIEKSFVVEELVEKDYDHFGKGIRWRRPSNVFHGNVCPAYRNGGKNLYHPGGEQIIR